MFIWCLNILVLLIAIGAVNGYRINKRSLSAPGASALVQQEIAELKQELDALLQNDNKQPLVEKINKKRKSIRENETQDDLDKQQLFDVLDEYEEKADPHLHGRYRWALEQKQQAMEYAQTLLDKGDVSREATWPAKMKIDEAIDELLLILDKIEESSKNEIKAKITALSNMRDRLSFPTVSELKAEAEKLYAEKRYEEAKREIEQASWIIREHIQTIMSDSTRHLQLHDLEQELEKIEELEKKIDAKCVEKKTPEFKKQYEEGQKLKEEAKQLYNHGTSTSLTDITKAHRKIEQAYSSIIQYYNQLKSEEHTQNKEELDRLESEFNGYSDLSVDIKILKQQLENKAAEGS